MGAFDLYGAQAYPGSDNPATIFDGPKAGLLSGLMNPQVMGLLGLAQGFAKAGAPSPYPTSFGQALSSGLMGGAQQALATQQSIEAGQLRRAQIKKLEQEAEKAKLESQLQQELTQGGGLLGADPDKVEAIGIKLGLLGHPGSAGMINAAQNIRTNRAKAAQFQTMRGSTETIQPDPQENQQAADYGTPEVAPTTIQKGGLFGTLVDSPYVGKEAGMMQGQINAAKAGDPEAWLKHYERLRAADATERQKADAAAERAANLPKSTIIVQDKNSPTGWSHLDTRTQERFTGAPPPSNAGAAAMGDIVPAAHKDLHGADYLSTLPTGMAELVKGIAEGRIDPSKASSLRLGNREAIMQRVLQYDPKYNQQRVKVYQDFTTGKTAQNITAMNTVIAHMGTVDELTDALKNKNVQTVNAVVNRLRTETGNPEINNAEVAIQAMGNELMRVFRQVNASQHEVEAWERKFNAAKGSPEQLKGALRVGVELLKGRLDAVNDQWKRGMDTESDFPGVLSAKSLAVLDRLGKKEAPSGPFSDPDKERRYQEWKKAHQK